MHFLKDTLEKHQIPVYFGSVLLAVVTSFVYLNTSSLEAVINPALALMLFVTFLQVPVGDLASAFKRFKFLIALLLSNFLLIPILVGLLIHFLPNQDMVKLGVLLVLLDYPRFDRHRYSLIKLNGVDDGKGTICRRI